MQPIQLQLQLPNELPFEIPQLIPEAYTLLSVGALVLSLLSFVLAWRALRRARHMMAHYEALMTGAGGTDLAAALEAQTAKARAADRRIRKLEERTAGLDGDIERLSEAESSIEHLRQHTADMGVHAKRIQGTETNMGDIESRVARLETRLRKAVQQVRLKRYRAFEDMGGDHSFALGLLDDRGDGVVISGLHSRSGIRVYAKPVEARRSDYALSDEEQEVIAKDYRPVEEESD
jgi:hypothetical protein